MTRTDATAPLLDEHTWSLLRQAHAVFHSEASKVYDEVLIEVSDRIRSSGSIGKTDVGALLFWKRLRADTRWVRELMVMADSEIRGTTGQAVSAVNDTAVDVASAAAEGRKALSALPGFVRGDALASALLTAAAPDRMAVYDRRAQAGLEKLGLSLSPARGRYGRYMTIVVGLASEAERRGHPWSPRQVDLALYALGGQKRIS